MAERTPLTKEEIDAWKRQRMEEFSRRLSALCNEYECDLEAIPQIVDGRIVAQIMAKPK